VDLAGYPWHEVDACFIALHGKFGEDGQVQQLLESLGVAYTGSGPGPSRLAMSKSATKECLRLHRISTPPYFLIHQREDVGSITDRAGVLGYPLFVKPDGAGSSIGVTPVAHESQLSAALDQAFRFDCFAVIERAIAGREMTVAVFGRDALPPVEILPTRTFFDYDAKYHDASTGYTFDVSLPAETIARMEQTAVAVCTAVGTRGLCRVDLMLDRQNQPWVLEINTIPGMTSHSLAPMAARRAGFEEQLCELLVLDAMEQASPHPLATVSA
jgi:D-alanine-D-alanine ligase